jgi:hypothetical protein
VQEYRLRLKRLRPTPRLSAHLNPRSLRSLVPTAFFRGSVCFASLLLYAQNPVLCCLGDAEFDNGLCWNLDLLLRLWVKAHARLSLLLHQLAKTGQDKFTVLFTLLVGERAERIEKGSSSSFVRLGGFGNCSLKFCLGHLKRIERLSTRFHAGSLIKLNVRNSIYICAKD